jgi:hemoglobin-like flavoprotein
MGLDTQVLRSSFNVALERQPNLTHVFYEDLFARHPAARPMFAMADMAAQERMLADALVAVVDHLEDVPWLQSTLAGLGAKHAGYGVTSEMYDWVAESLVSSLAAASGPEWTADVAAAWQDAYAAIVGMMLAGYPAAAAATDSEGA